MKKTLLLIVLLLSTGVLFSQNLPDYSKLQSIVKQPSGWLTSPLGTTSTTITTNGFDNFYLGVDFGEPYIATNPNDPLNSVCAFNMNNFYYTLNGYNWIKTGVAFSGFAVIGDPVLTFDSLGNAYYIQLYQNGSTYGLVVAKSTDKGITWGAESSVYSTSVGLCDKEWIAADFTGGPYSNNIYVVWRQFGSTNMRFVRSTNFGQTWSSPMTYTGDQGAYVTIGANGSIQGGSVYIACAYGSSTRVSRSTDGGLTFGSAVTAASFSGPGIICSGRYTVKGCIRTDNFPRMAADNSYTSTRGNVYEVYASAQYPDIYLVRSTNQGTTWSAPVKVNDDNTTTDQWMPSINVDKNGKIYISWYDSRVDPSNNLLTKLYGTVSTDGGLTFAPNFPISDVSFNPDNMKVSQGSGQAYYIGDYIGTSITNNVGYAVWMDGRNNSLGSYTGFYPDFAMTTSKSEVALNNNDSSSLYVKVPALKGPYSGRVKFTAALDTLPSSGTITFSFANGKDSITTFPDSVMLKIKASSSVTSKLYKINIIGKGINGTPIHKRAIDLAINSSFLSVGTNREGVVQFNVNGTSYMNHQTFVLPNNSNALIQAPSPQVQGSVRYVYLNWSNGGDTNQNIIVNGALNLTATYKVQYKLVIVSSQGNTFGGNNFYDSAAYFQFGVNSRTIINGGTTYYFRGWTGAGVGGYTSPDSTGLDSVVTWALHNPVLEQARWTSWPNSIRQIGSEIPLVYNLFQNYPNPFNPSTTIKYDIVNQGIVRISIYDVLGKEVNTLVNSLHSPGKYEVVMNVDNLSSGIYYYKITAGNFNAVKKMIIIK
ncbi:MAG TPA: T9SS type A sorting domain-containing protein [Ignavibacteria bacterium]